MSSGFKLCLDFDYIFYSFRDINDHYFNWPINQLRNLLEFFKHSQIHTPHSELLYAVKIVILSIIFSEKMGLPFYRRGRRGRRRGFFQ